MKKRTKEILFYKKESQRTRSEKMVRAIVFFGVVIFTAALCFMYFSANAQLAEAEADFADTGVQHTSSVQSHTDSTTSVQYYME